MNLSAHCGGLKKSENATARFCSEPVRCLRSSQKAERLFVCPQRFGSSGSHPHRASRKSGRQKRLRLAFLIELEAPKHGGFRDTAKDASVTRHCQETQTRSRVTTKKILRPRFALNHHPETRHMPGQVSIARFVAK